MKVTVYKFNPATDAEPYYVSGEVPYTKDMSALHALKLFNENVAQVNYDYSCRGRLCGAGSAGGLPWSRLLLRAEFQFLRG